MANGGIVEWVLKVTNQASKPVDDVKKSVVGLDEAVSDASKGVKDLGETAGGIAPKVVSLGNSTRQAGAPTNELGKASGRAAEGLARLGGALSIVSPEAGALVGEAGRMAGGLRTITEGAEAAGVGLGTVGLAVGALAVVLGVGYGAWKQLHEEEEADAEITKSIGDARKKLKPLFDAERDALVDLRIATGELTEAEGASLKKRMAAHQLLNDTLAANQAKITELYAGEGSLGRAIGDIAENNQKGWLGSLDIVSMAIDGMTTSTDEAAQQVGELSAGQLQLTADVKKANDTIDVATGKIKQYKDAASGATKAVPDITKDGAVALSEGIGNSDTAGYLAGAKAEAEASKAARRHIVDLMTQNEQMKIARLSGIERINAAETEAIRENGIALGRELEDFKGAQDQKLSLIRAYEERATQIHADASAARAKGDGALSVAQGAVGFAKDPLGAIGSSTGPWGAVIVGAMEAIANLDDTLSGLSDWGAQFQEGLKNGGKDIANFIVRQINQGDPSRFIFKFIEGLVDGIPRMIQAAAGQMGPMAAALIEGLLLGIPKIIVSLVTGLFDPANWEKAAESFLKGIVSGFTKFGKDFDKATAAKSGTTKSTMGNPISDAIAAVMTGQSHADGARYADRTGYMMVHKGERIDTADQVQRGESGGQRGTGRGRMLGAGGKVYIEIDADSLDDTLGQLGRRGYRLGSA